MVLIAAVYSVFSPAHSWAGDPLPHRLFSIDLEGDDETTTVALIFDREPDVSLRMLRGPERLIVDLPATAFEMAAEKITPKGLIQSIRYGAMDKERSRMVIGLRGPFTLEEQRAEKDEDGRYRLAFTFNLASRTAFESMLRKRAVPADAVAISTQKAERLNGETSSDKPFTVVVDAGHGGIDHGAHGRHGVKEKTITLAFARQLKEQLEKIDGVRAVLTRDDDSFISLNQRVRIGRQAGANLFISIHADSVRQSYVRGATVYTISKKASDAMAADLADSENAVDMVAGLDLPEEDEEVTDILLDLTRRETKGFSLRFAGKLVESMDDVLLMIKRPHRHAGFRVLTAPDVPSVLVELGYLSNDRDEKLLQDDEWRRRAATAIAAAVKKYASARMAALR
ncbi:N-acetylmuramoyl-L-alanine amidase [Notoacmeibacter sp. MSK16QG-6]|uniref:N-acetylmuramoyl-L-alanine amidase n=1 Tax=Notoacmeibacter sp. MSK16QG-6 TaxID=2957982 RepID=UPI0020A1EFE7|nr:N-acetylmuramoyl-L-alanine amidase [Notoacmeibacter sp. MSK16QG-6]MCP1197844.1 N-acetylmuramoyl-L-alanine amidase [Notoacmeibacter sp. MSK16QG-6]